MEKSSMDQYTSFNKIGHVQGSFNNNNNDHHATIFDRSRSRSARDDNEPSPALDDLSRDVDEFITILDAIDDKSLGLPDVPPFVKSFSKALESTIARYTSSSGESTFGKSPKDDSLFVDSVLRISKLTTALSEFPPDHPNICASINRTSVALQRAMLFLEEEFRLLLEPVDSRVPTSDHAPDPHIHKFSSFNNSAADRCSFHPPDPDYPSYPPESVSKMREIAKSMISAGYETECRQVYYLARRAAIRAHLRDVTLNMEDVVKMPWDILETEVSRWIGIVRTWSEVVLPGERNLADSVFSGDGRLLLGSIVRGVVLQLLDFPEAAAMAKRSAEKLFKYLDMYEALMKLMITGDEEVTEEVMAAADLVGESAASIFLDLESSIRSDTARTPVPGGAVHPLTRYVMNYLKYACEYKDTLGRVFADSSPRSSSSSPFSRQVVRLMDLLDDNLERKSTLYKDPSLRNVFLMNNGRYILQKAKGSTEIRQVMGDTWCRKRSTVVRMYHKNYQRETWNRVLQCLSHDGLLTNGKPNKPLLKERFKIFTAIFDEIHRTQSAWVVSDEQLQSELRISISSVVIPAYRSFVGRFRQYLDSRKQADKYIKYQPEDIEGLIEGLFEGNNNTSMGRRRT